MVDNAMTKRHDNRETCGVHGELITLLTKLDNNLKWIILVGGALIVFMAWSVRTILPEIKEFNQTLSAIDKENGVQTSEIDAVKKVAERNAHDINDLRGQIRKMPGGAGS